MLSLNINNLKQQYYYREPNGYLTKVVGDTTFVTPPNGAVPSPGYKGTNSVPPGKPVQPADLQKKSEKVIEKTKANQKAVKAQKTAKSKTNKKTIESF